MLKKTMNMHYNKEENEILQLHKNNQLIVSESRNEDLRRAKRSANKSLNRLNKMSIQLSESDLVHLKEKEIETGMTSQKIVTTLIHSYLNNIIKLSI